MPNGQDNCSNLICSGNKVLIILEGDKKYLTYLLRWNG